MRADGTLAFYEMDGTLKNHQLAVMWPMWKFRELAAPPALLAVQGCIPFSLGLLGVRGRLSLSVFGLGAN